MSPVTARAPDLGAPIPAFRLPEPLTGRLIGPEDFPKAAALLVVFLCNRCPQVAHVAGALAELARDLDPAGLQVLAVNSTEIARGDDEGPAATAAEALKRGYVFPYVIDQTQAVARAYGAACTPDFYLFDRQRRLTYHGRFDDTRFGGTRAAHGGDLRRAVEGALNGEPPPAHQVAAQGCLIRRRLARPQQPAAGPDAAFG